MAIPSTHSPVASAQPRLASRRHWLKGLGALVGTGLLTAPTALLAAPAPAEPALPNSAPVGGDEYIGMVKILATDTLPTGWALCDGRHLSVAEHPGLFALLGTHYGGDGRSTFALPNLSDATKFAATLPVTENAPTWLHAIKIANAPATTCGVTELRMHHHGRTRTARQA